MFRIQTTVECSPCYWNGNTWFYDPEQAVLYNNIKEMPEKIKDPEHRESFPRPKLVRIDFSDTEAAYYSPSDLQPGWCIWSLQTDGQCLAQSVYIIE